MRISRFSQMFLLLMVSGWGTVWAAPEKSLDASISQQSAKITTQGTIVDAQGEPLIGVSILEVGTTNGTITDIDGKFTLQVASGATLEISYIGYKTQQLTATPDFGTIKMSDDTEVLQEVVVTALGIKREKKALGYAIQEVKGESLVEARETNLANALSGKISGVQVIRSSNGPGGSSKIQLRGANSVTGTNQPLIVVDGVPMDNFTGADNADFYNPSLDMGNGLSDINPEDIESMSVLKGASAAALYGSRAGNGVILITTKKGTKREGLGITISGSVSAETIFMNPKMQKAFGQGDNGSYNAETSNSWGPAMGTEYTFNGQKRIMQYYDNVDSFFKTGTNLTESISFSQQYDKTSIYASLNRMDDSSKIPGATLDRTNLTLRAFYTFGKDDRWSLDAKVQYINTNADNRPMTGSNDQNMFRTIYQLPSSMDIRDYSNPLTDEGKINWYNNSGMNPYWAELYNTNHDTRNRFLMNASLKYKFTDWLNAEIKAGSDMYNTESNNKLYAGSNRNNGNSQYSLEEKKFYENNFSFLISAQKDHLINKFGGTMTFGGNLMERKSTGLKGDATKLTVPNLFNLLNSSKNDRNFKETYNHKKINSLYGTLGINYDGWIFLDATFRNDWSSALSKENRSFFYPSISASWIISDMVGKIGKMMPSWFTYAKVRASFAQVGNDMDAYQLYNYYEISSDPNGNTTGKPLETYYDSTVRSELISSWEAGVELKFFNNRLGFDFAWYKSNAKRQLMDIPMDYMSGYKARKINAGNIQNSGVELMLYGTILQNPRGLNWETTLNASFNKNKIIDLYEGVNEYGIKTFDDLKIVARTGSYYGDIYGKKFQRVESGEHAGKIIVDAQGLPLVTSDDYYLGNQQPDCMLGWTNSFSYKNISLSFLIDARIGGNIYSATTANLYKAGNAAGTVINGTREEFVVPNSVTSDGNGGYTANSNAVTPELYWGRAAGGNIGVGEAFLYDATNIRLRNITVGYDFEKKWLEKTPLQKVRVSFVANNVWMIVNHLEGIDPESISATNSNATGFENGAAPTSRSFTFNVTVGF